MNETQTTISFELLSKCAVLGFLAILFLQSSIDKILHSKDNLQYLHSVFEKSPLKNSVKLLFPAITILEFSAGISSGIGAVLLGFGNNFIGKLAIVLCSLALLCLFFGQRIAKDYAGAASLAAYFAVVLLGYLLLL